MTWKLPGYVADELLGYGGFGEVWRGHANGTGTPVALKRLPVGDAAQVQAARAEAALLSTLDHPHLIRLHELVPIDDAVVLVLDLAAGGSLADLLGRRGRLTPGEVVTALAPVGAALAYAHDEAVVHGDVTPANILFTAAGLPLLADLGVARIVGDAAIARSTPAYVDPSVAAGCAPGTPSDVFMLAAVTLHALTGAAVWTGVAPQDVLAHAAAGELDDLPERLRGLPADLASLLERGLRVEPHLRCNAAEFALDLRHSAEPAPVELAAGRAGQPAEPVTGEPPDPGGDPARPMFPRPGLDTPMSNPAQLTHGVRAALHAPVPAHRRRLQVGRRARLLGLAAVLIAAVAAVGWTARADGHVAHPDPTRPASSTATPHASSSPSQPTMPPSRPSTPSAAHGVGTEARAIAVLHGLDRLREQAFARREASLLAHVYLPGPLLAQDTALLERVVPPGCALLGVHTTYSGVRVTSSPGRLVLSATATLAPSTLTCHAARTGGAPGEKPTRLRIELVHRPDGYRIASQRKLD